MIGWSASGRHEPSRSQTMHTRSMSTPYASRIYVASSQNSAVTGTLGGIAAAWFVADAALGALGFFSEHRQFIFLFVLAPMMVFAIAFAVSPKLRAWAFALDTRTL